MTARSSRSMPTPPPSPVPCPGWVPCPSPRTRVRKWAERGRIRAYARAASGLTPFGCPVHRPNEPVQVDA